MEHKQDNNQPEQSIGEMISLLENEGKKSLTLEELTQMLENIIYTMVEGNSTLLSV